MKLRQKSKPLLRLSTSLSIDAPVVVKPLTVSKSASIKLGIYPETKKGVAVSGDSVIADEAKKNYFKNEFSAMSCDMESAAVAYVCEQADIPFAAVRRISDDAGNDATDSYTEMNDKQEDVLIKLLVDASKRFFDYPDMWK